MNETQSSTAQDTTFFYIGYRVGGSEKTFDHDNITGQVITINNHGFGAVGTKVYVNYTEGDSQIPYLLDGSNFLMEITSADSLTMVDGHISYPGTGNGHKFTLNNSLIAFLPDEDYEIPILNLGTEQVSKIAHLNNILIINTAVSVYFIYWDYDDMEYRQLTHPELPILSLPKSDLDEVFNAMYKERIQLDADGDIMTCKALIAGDYPEFPEYFSKLVDYMANKKKNNAYVESYVMIIVAYRLFDGSFIMHSQPLITYIGNMQSRFYLKATNDVTEYYINRNSGYREIYAGSPKLTINNINMVSLADEWKDIISGLTIFMTRPLPFFTMPQTGTGYKWKTRQDTVPPANPIEGTFYIQQSDAIKVMIDDPVYYRVKEVSWEDLTTGPMKQTIDLGLNAEDIKTEFNYYLPIDSFTHHRLLSAEQYIFNRRLHQGNITTIFGKADSQLLTDAYFDETEKGEGYTKVNTNTVFPNCEFWIEVSIRTNSGNRYILQQFTPNVYLQGDLSYTPGGEYPGGFGSGSGSWSLSGSSGPIEGTGPLGPSGDYPMCIIPFMPIISYPDPRAFKMRIMVRRPRKTPPYDQTYHSLYTFDLKAHPFLSMAYWANYTKIETLWTQGGEEDPDYYGYEHLLISLANDTVLHETTPETDNRYYLDENRLQVSRIDNPFVGEAKHSYQVGGQDSKILGIATSSVQVSDGQFGEFPLFIFTNEGVYTLRQGIDPAILYSTISPVSKERLLPGTICEIGAGIIYCTADGVKLMSGTSVKNLSESMLLGSDNHLVGDADYLKLINGEGLAVVDLWGLLDAVDFKQYIAGATIAFDSYQSEIIICNPTYDYSYLYNLKFDVWSKISQTWDYFIVINPKFYGVNVGTLKDMEAENAGADKSFMIQTKPLKLESQGFKTIERTVIRQYLECGVSEQSTSSSGGAVDIPMAEGVYLFGTGNGTEWKLLRGVNVKRTTSKYAVTRIVIPASFVSVRYLIILIVGKSSEYRFSHLEIMFSHKIQNKIR